MHTFARIMVDLAHARGIKAIVALRGGTAMSLAREFKPDSITLDVRLPDMSGWALLDRLKHEPQTAHIPVHVISGHENNRRGFALGATSCLQKAVSKESLEEVYDAIGRSMNQSPKTVLLIAENDVRTADLRGLLAGGDVRIHESTNLEAGEQFLADHHVDVIVLDWVLPDERGIEFIERVQAKSPLHVPADHRFGHQPPERTAGERDSQVRARRSGALCAGPGAGAGGDRAPAASQGIDAQRGAEKIARRRCGRRIGCWRGGKFWWWTTICATFSR